VVNPAFRKLLLHQWCNSTTCVPARLPTTSMTDPQVASAHCTSLPGVVRPAGSLTIQSPGANTVHTRYTAGGCSGSRM
jgi:hypothetical protein